MDLNDKLNQIKIKDIIIIYLFSISIVSGIIFCVIKVNHREIGNFVLNTLSLILQVIILISLLIKLKPSSNNILCVYEDFKIRISMLEVAEVTLTKICISVGGSKLIVSFFYYLDPSAVNNFICESGSMINSVRNYVINLILLLIVSPIT